METCHNPACRRPVERRNAFLRSVSLELVAFCSRTCVDRFAALDRAIRQPAVPAQRRPLVHR